jgi:hypothetical protein
MTCELEELVSEGTLPTGVFRRIFNFDLKVVILAFLFGGEAAWLER